MFDIKSKKCLMKEFEFESEKKSSDKAMISNIYIPSNLLILNDIMQWISNNIIIFIYSHYS